VTGGAGGEVVQVLVLGVVQAENAGEGVDDGGAGPGFLAAFQAGVVVDADPGEGGEFLAAQPGVRRRPVPAVSPASAGVTSARRARRNRPSSLPSLRCCWFMFPVRQPCDAGGRRVGGPVTPWNAAPRHSAVCHYA
jgi:hypothetical protein